MLAGDALGVGVILTFSAPEKGQRLCDQGRYGPKAKIRHRKEGLVRPFGVAFAQ